MEHELIGYVLNALDEPTKRRVDEYLAAHPEVRAKLALVQQAVAPLEADREAEAAPALLAERTLARVAEHVCNPERPSHDLPQAPPVVPTIVPSGRSWWRRADVLVAACILFTIGGIGVLTLAKLRGPSSAAMMAGCKNNLREFYVALQTYRDTHRRLPDISQEEAPRNVAGMVVPLLQDAGTLPASASIRCPAVGAPLPCQDSLTNLRAMSPDDFEQRSPCLSMCYAYSLGYRDEAGKYHPPGSAPPGNWSQTPIMADRPPPVGILGNSINHGGGGQNVLFADGHVQYLPSRTLANGDDIFLNRSGKLAAGLDAGDIVLGPSAARP